MGLDQYFKVRKKEAETAGGEDIAYLRKANALQNYFEVFHNLENCQAVILDEDIVKDLKNCLKGTIEILRKLAKDSEEEKCIINLMESGYEPVSDKYPDKIEEANAELKDYFDRNSDKLEELLKENAKIKKAFCPTSGFFYGSTDIKDFALWQMRSIKSELEEVFDIYNDLKEDEEIIYYSWY